MNKQKNLERKKKLRKEILKVSCVLVGYGIFSALAIWV